VSEHRAVLSVDYEWFAHTPAYRTADETHPDEAIGRKATEFLLDAFDDRGTHSTFFTVAEITDTDPEVVKEISDEGHEIASHTRSHRHLSELSEQERTAELTDSKELLEDASDTEVTGFRAPSFDLPRGAFSPLADAGYEYDSSIVPSRSIPGWYGGEHTVQAPCSARLVDETAPSAMMELPVAVMPGLRLPLTGTWIRFFGVNYTLLGMRLLARRGVAPILYIHPWELVELPRLPGVPSRVYWRTGSWMRRAVSRLLDSSFEYVPAQKILETDG